MGSANILFSQIPASIRKSGKYFEFNTSLAVNTLPQNLQLMLIIAQMLTTLGDTIVTNGDMAGATIAPWTGTDWAYNAANGGEALCTAGGTNALAQAAPAIVGQAYKITYTLFSVSGASPTLTASFGGLTDTPRSAAGTYTFSGTATTTAGPAFTPNAAFAGGISDISIQPYGPPATCNAAPLAPAQVFSESDAIAYFGVGSMAHLMTRAAINANPYLQLTVIGLSDAAESAAATGTITITGPATSSGHLDFFIGNNDIEIAVNSGDTADVIAANLLEAIQALPSLPVSSAVGGGASANVITLTALNKGSIGNQIPLGYALNNATGVTITIVAMANGAVDPDISGALAVTFGSKYDIIVTPYNNETSLTELRTYIEEVSNAIEERPGIVIYGFTGVLSAATTLAGEINDGRTLCAYHRYTSATPQQSMPYEIAAAFGSVKSFEEDPAMPLDTLALTGIAPCNIADMLSRAEQESLLYNGVTPLEVGPGQVVQIVRAISTYTLDAQGIPDISLLDITTICTLDYVRLALRTRIALRFPRSKLDAKTPPRVRTELYDVLKQLELLEIVENVDQYKDGILVEPDLTDPNRLDAKIPTNVVPGLHIFAGRIDLIL